MDDQSLLEDELIDSFGSFWGNRARDYVVKESAYVPWTMLTVHFTLYNYFIIGFSVERSTASFGIITEGCWLNIGRMPVEQVVAQLPAMDVEVKLRIPGKYLRAKGWE